MKLKNVIIYNYMFYDAFQETVLRLLTRVKKYHDVILRTKPE